MKQTPCEYLMWNGLPVIRKEIAKSMMINFGLNQNETAEKLKLTPAAVCQYVSEKRGKIKIIDKKIINEIDKSAELIIQQGEAVIIPEICRICKILQEKEVFPSLCKICQND